MAVRKAEVKVEQVPLSSLKAYDGNAKRYDNRNGYGILDDGGFHEED